ncbi:hypothetical protein ACIHDR_46065 [Nocardia sp. NPDC052278]|uniref:hypothetical protein n=1 Tax=unclassified Nocardia TaxID=2637762 RepID=UPI00368164AC
MTDPYSVIGEFTEPEEQTTLDPIGRDRAPDLTNGAGSWGALIPTEMQTAPIRSDYGLNAVLDASLAGHARLIQNLAAEHSRLIELGQRQSLDRDQFMRRERLSMALEEATHAASSHGLGQADIADSVAAGSEGIYWHERPGARHLGRIEQLTAALAASAPSELDRVNTELAAEKQHNRQLSVDNAALHTQLETMNSHVMARWSDVTATDIARSQDPVTSTPHRGPEPTVGQANTPLNVAFNLDPPGAAIGESVAALGPARAGSEWSAPGDDRGAAAMRSEYGQATGAGADA